MMNVIEILNLLHVQVSSMNKINMNQLLKKLFTVNLFLWVSFSSTHEPYVFDVVAEFLFVLSFYLQ